MDANRELANQLLAAADLWLFVTTAARYADAVPWHVLRTARDRGTVIAIVLDRVPPGADDEVAAHLREMLAEQHLGGTTLFVLPETTVDGSGLLPDVARRAAPRLARPAGGRRGRAGGGDPHHGQRRGRGRSWSTWTRWPRPPTSRPGRGPTLDATARAAYDDGERRDRARVSKTARCCAARCWPAGRSSSVPAT